MRKGGKLHRYYRLIEGETICNPISNEKDLISNPSNINEFLMQDNFDFFSRLKFYSMLDYRYGSYTEIINQNFRPFKKR